MPTAREKNAAARKSLNKKKAGTKAKPNVYLTTSLAFTKTAPPAYVEDMRDLLVKIWNSEKTRAEFAINPTEVFRQYGLLPKGSKTVVVAHFQEKGRFDVVIPPKRDLNPDDLMMLAHHLIRCCAAC